MKTYRKRIRMRFINLGEKVTVDFPVGYERVFNGQIKYNYMKFMPYENECRFFRVDKYDVGNDVTTYHCIVKKSK